MKIPLPVVLQFRQQSGYLGEPDMGETYYIQVVKAPGWGWGGPLQAMGLDSQQIRNIRTLYRDFIERSQSNQGQALGQTMLHSLRLVGNQLFESLPESIQTRLQQAQAIAQEKQRGLELVLLFEPTAESLVDLPWELLHNPAGGSFFALRGGGVSRRLLLPISPKTNQSFRPQAVLGLWAEPQKAAPLDTRRGYAPAPGQGEEIAWLKGADSLGQLRRALEGSDFDGLHIVAHGRIGPNWSDFALALEDEGGRSHWIGADHLATFISQYPQLRFIYLDVCAGGVSSEAGKTAEETERIGIGGLAGRLLGVGIPAVVVMQDTMSQKAAGLAAKVFYRELARGKTVAEALTDGRRAVRLEQDDPIHWSVPALYQQERIAKENSSAADWVLDRALEIGHSTTLLLGLALAVLIGRLSHPLAQLRLDIPADWLALPPILLESMLLPILAAALTSKGQEQLQEKYNLKGRTWLPFLLHKYFSAMIWTMLTWLSIWLIWLALYWSGFAGLIGEIGRQGVWVICLLGIATASYVGVRQAIRQNLLFLRVGFSLFKIGLVDFLLLLFMLTLAPFVPFLFLGVVVYLWLALGGSPAQLGLVLVASITLMATLLHLSLTRR